MDGWMDGWMELGFIEELFVESGGDKGG